MAAIRIGVSFIMKYHPDRYYLLISIPLIILSARFFVTRDYVNLVELTKQLKISPSCS
jgi:hypothetical protein